jgi:SPP1 family predicted phage head-tail adaptor
MAIGNVKGIQSSGDLRSRISFQQATLTDDGAGGRSRAWVTIGSAWAGIEPWKGNENITADQLRAAATFRVVTRYRTDIAITAKLRILYGSRVFEILSIADPGDKHDFYDLVCSEVLT